MQGNYIGVDPTGTIDKGNGFAGFTHPTPSTGINSLIGGLDPEDRNIISGNGSSGGYPQTGDIIQGNYVGVGADGLTSIPNSVTNEAGAFSIDECEDVLVGGNDPGAINVISGNASHGIAPNFTSNLEIIGNYIGVGYDGVTTIGNSTIHPFKGEINLGANSGPTLISGNIIAGGNKSGTGIYIGQQEQNITIEDNTIYGNKWYGINISEGSNNMTIGRPGHGNYIFNNGSDVSALGSNAIGSNIYVFGASPIGSLVDKIKIQSNTIGIDKDSNYQTTDSGGVLILGDPTNVLIGGANDGEGNTIWSNSEFGVGLIEFRLPNLGIAVAPKAVSVLRNSIYNSKVGGVLGASSGLGIDLFTAEETSEVPDFSPEQFIQNGVTPNDTSDGASGPNGFLNYPVISKVSKSGSNAVIQFSYTPNSALAANGGYRIEFFASNEKDPTGHGEGRVYLGSVDVATGGAADQSISLSLPQGQSFISATATMIDDSQEYGYGATSEFSQVVEVEDNQSSQSGSGSLAGTGSNSTVIIYVAVVMSVLAVGLLVKSRFIDK